MLTSKIPHRGGGLKKGLDLSTVHDISRIFELLPLRLHPSGGVGVNVVLLFWAVRDISWTFEFLTH